MKISLFLFSFLCGSFLYAQVGIGTDTPNPSAQLEVVSQDRGILLPKVALTGLKDQTTIEGGNVESLLLYNTTENDSIRPGYYYWSGDRWHRLLTINDIHPALRQVIDTTRSH